MNAGIESTFANHSLIKQLLEPFRLLSRHTPIPAGLLHLGAEVVDSQLKNDN